MLDSQERDYKRVLIIASADERVRSRVMAESGDLVGEWKEALGGAEALELHDASVHEGAQVTLLIDDKLPDLDGREVEAMAKRRSSSTTVYRLPLAPDHASSLANRYKTIQSTGATASRLAEAPLPGMVGESVAMQRVYRMVRLVAARDTTVLITGETGTGKELIARSLHLTSNRAGGPFITVNCSAIPDTLLESELFGYVKGAFTGAAQASIGRIKAAEGGTLFLDEIGELSPTMQAKLLRFLQEGEVQRLGENKPLRVNVRVVAATNIDLTERTPGRVGGFRQDLYYRLAVFPIELPKLKDRVGDALLLARFFLRQYAGAERCLAADAEQAISQYCWPGNVRELQHAIERAVILAQDEVCISSAHLGLSIGQMSFF